MLYRFSLGIDLCTCAPTFCLLGTRERSTVSQPFYFCLTSLTVLKPTFRNSLLIFYGTIRPIQYFYSYLFLVTIYCCDLQNQYRSFFIFIVCRIFSLKFKMIFLVIYKFELHRKKKIYWCKIVQ